MVKDLHVHELQQILGLSQVAVSKQLAILLTAGALKVERDGNLRRYMINRTSADFAEHLDFLQRYAARNPEFARDLRAVAALRSSAKQTHRTKPDVEIPQESETLESHLL